MDVWKTLGLVVLCLTLGHGANCTDEQNQTSAENITNSSSALNDIRVHYLKLEERFQSVTEEMNSTIETLESKLQEIQKEVKSLPTRLRGGRVSFVGRLEVNLCCSWGTVCDDSFDHLDAYVACRSMGYTSGCFRPDLTINAVDSNKMDILLDDLKCKGTEINLLYCDHGGRGVHNCGHSEDVKIFCSHKNITSCNLRLAGGNSPAQGRLEVLNKGTWGTVCDDGFGTVDAKVVCKTMGLSGGAILKSDSIPVGSSSSKIWMDEVHCTGNEDSLFDCPFAGFGTHNCQHSEDVKINCNT